MCGTVGLFTGCAAAAFCPVSQLTRNHARTDDSSAKFDDSLAQLPDYRTPFANWDRRASVRSSPRRTLTDDTGDLFPADLVPVAKHELVAGLRPELFRRLLTQQLYRYLHFTSKLEFMVVNYVVLGISQGNIQVPIPDQMRFDALKIYCDEAYHGYFSVDLMRQVQARTGIAPRINEEPYFLRRLAALKEKHDPAKAGFIDLLFTIVSETLITASLTEISKSREVSGAVVDTLHDHAVDEGRHHAYFASYLTFLWASLNRAERTFSARLFPELIDVFLRPDVPSIGTELGDYGLKPDEVAQVLAETFSERTQADYNRATASKLLGYLREIEAFDDPGARYEAQSRGLLPG